MPCLVCQTDKTEKGRRKVFYDLHQFQKGHGKVFLWILLEDFQKVQGYRSVLVVVDWLSKYAIFIPTQHKCPTEEAARLFFSNVLKHFGVLEDIRSDKDL